MMPYDLYGQYYASARDAANAEMAQCASIEADLVSRKVIELENKLLSQQEPTQEQYEISYLWSAVKELEQRIEKLELLTGGK